MRCMDFVIGRNIFPARFFSLSCFVDYRYFELSSYRMSMIKQGYIHNTGLFASKFKARTVHNVVRK